MNYRNIVDVKVKDLVPLCRECHELIEEAKAIGLIRKKHTTKALLEVTKEGVHNEKRRLSLRVPLPAKVLSLMTIGGPQCYKLVFGIIKQFPSHPDEWGSILVTGRQLDRIYPVVNRNWGNGLPELYREAKFKRVTSGKSSAHY